MSRLNSPVSGRVEAGTHVLIVSFILLWGRQFVFLTAYMEPARAVPPPSSKTSPARRVLPLDLKDLRLSVALLQTGTTPVVIHTNVLVSEETSISFYSTTINGQPSSTDKKKSLFYFTVFLSFLFISVLWGVLFITQCSQSLEESSLRTMAFSGTPDHCVLNKTQNSSDQRHWEVTRGQSTFYLLSYIFFMMLLHKTHRYTRLN